MTKLTRRHEPLSRTTVAGTWGNIKEYELTFEHRFRSARFVDFTSNKRVVQYERPSRGNDNAEREPLKIELVERFLFHVLISICLKD